MNRKELALKYIAVIYYLFIMSTNLKGALFDKIPSVFGGTTIFTGVITGSPFCVGATNIAVSVPYTSTVFQAGNVFSAQLSSATGSFASPTVIGTLASNTSGTILANIPAGTPTGTGYRIRVVGSNVVWTGTNSTTTITINSPASILTQSFTNQSICANDVANLALTAQNALSYQWFSNINSNSGGVSEGSLNGAQTPSFLVQTNIFDTYYYYCNVTGSCGAPVASNVYTITVNPLPALILISTIDTLCVG